MFFTCFQENVFFYVFCTLWVRLPQTLQSSHGTPVHDVKSLPPPIDFNGSTTIPTPNTLPASLPSDQKTALEKRQSMVQTASLLDDELLEAKAATVSKSPTTPVEEPKKLAKAKSKCSNGKPKGKPVVKKEACGKKQKPAKKGSSKASRDKQHYDKLLAAGIPAKLLRQRSSGCARCRNRKWCTRSCWILRGFTP